MDVYMRQSMGEDFPHYNNHVPAPASHPLFHMQTLDTHIHSEVTILPFLFHRSLEQTSVQECILAGRMQLRATGAGTEAYRQCVLTGTLSLTAEEEEEEGEDR